MAHINTDRTTLATVAVAAFLAGLLAPGPLAVDPDVVALLRFMAVLKGAMAVAAALLVDWRLRSPMRPAPRAAAMVATALMAAATGLIWSLAHVALGAVLFHAGLLTLLVLAWRDDRRPWPSVLVRRSRAQGWATGTATSFLRRNGSVQGGS